MSSAVAGMRTKMVRRWHWAVARSTLKLLRPGMRGRQAKTGVWQEPQRRYWRPNAVAGENKSRTPCTGRLDRTLFCLCWSARHQINRLLISNRQEKTWRPNTHSLAERQVTVRGRHGHMPAGWIVYRRRSPAGRVNSRNGSLTQGGKVSEVDV